MNTKKAECKVPVLLRQIHVCLIPRSRILKGLMFYFFSLGPLVGKVKEHHVETIVDSLCSNMLSDNEQLRDISSIGEYAEVFCCCFVILCLRH